MSGTGNTQRSPASSRFCLLPLRFFASSSAAALIYEIVRFQLPEFITG